MAAKIENEITTKLDGLKWLLVAILTGAGLYANYYYSQLAWPLRFIVGLGLLAVIAGIISQTMRGIQVINFARESRMELRRVVWPTRHETLMTTFAIGVIVLVLAIALWIVDGGLVSIIAWLTGQRG